MYEAVRIAIEIVSIVICIILVRFMIRPYQLTAESRYLGLPLGFIFLGTSYGIAALAWGGPANFFNELAWLQLLTRTFAFVFFATTYYFSKEPSKNTRLSWNITLSLLVVALITLLLTVFIVPQVAPNSLPTSALYVRVFGILCLTYISIHTLRSHVRDSDPKTIWIPQGFILLAISQYSFLFWYTDTSLAAFWGSLALRLLSLAVFLFIAYRAFHRSRKRNP